LGGNSGKIEINATDAVEISGRLPVSLIGKSRAESILFTRLLTSAGGNATGKAGDININVPNGSLRVADGASLRAETEAAFGGGNINVNAKVVELTGGGKLRTTTSSSGDAGNITFNNTERITISGNISGFDEILNEVAEKLEPQDLDEITDPGYIAPSGVYATTSETSTGKGGNVEITTRKLQVQDNGQINVSSDGQGNAGLLKVTANSIFLDNNGRLQAATAFGEGGNIDLNVRDYILMRRQSQISAAARNNAKGGNITISSPNGFVVTANNEDSNIVATAEKGQGGNITITSSGVYGFEISPSVTRSETFSDINATSQAGPQFNGTVLINNPNVDPSRGLVELPIVVADVSAPINSGCAAFAKSGGNQFIVTGRGGLPPSPYEMLSNDVVWLDTRISEITTQQQRSEIPAAKPPSKDHAVAIVPATGWVFNGKGQVTLISHTSGANGSGSTAAKCPN
jgi:large exoprotein involved in heme utilization and adhesion